MPRAPHVPAELASTPFRGSGAVAAGLITPAGLRARCWRRLLRDVYCHTDLPDDIDLRAAAVALVLPPGAVVAGHHAAWLYGVDVAARGAPVQVCVPRGTVLRRPGVAPYAAKLADDDVTTVRGLPVTTPLRTALDLARRESLTEAVVAVDALAHAGLVDGEALLAFAGEHRGLRGIRQVARVVDLHAPGSESPMESRLRMVVVVVGGLPRPEVQLEVYDGPVLVARLDLGYRRARVGLEYDGRDYHAGLAALRDDRRDNGLATHGYLVLRYDAAAVFRHPRVIVAQVSRALRRAA